MGEAVKVSIRIMHVAEAPGGVERYLVTLLTKLKQYPEFEHILVCSSAFDRNKFRGLVSDIRVVDELRNAISPVHDFRAIRAVRKLIRRHRPDIVYCHSSKAGAVGRIANMRTGIRCLYNAHGWAFNMRGKSRIKTGIYRHAERLLSPAADRIVCISDSERRSALEHRICGENRLVVIENGIDFDEFQEVHAKSRQELGIPEKSFVVGTIGRLSAQKAPDVFVRMAAEVKKQAPEAFFLMVGDGQEKEAVLQMIHASGLDGAFLITGWVDDPLDYLGAFDVATLLSRWEGFGLVLPEYMASGKPIVACGIDAIPEVLGDAGLCVDSDDYKRAAEAVLAIRNDSQLRNRMVERGLDRVKRFDARRVASEHARLFQTIGP